MSTSTTGRVLRGVGGLPWVGLRVTVTDLSAVLADLLLTSQITDADGRFALVYGADGTLGLPARRLLVQVTDRAGRELARAAFDDEAVPVHALPDFIVPPAEAEGLQVTLGTGTAAFVSSGNAVSWLVDNVEAWRHLGRLLDRATSSIEFMQMQYDVPKRFHADPGDETPVIVFEFASPPPTADSPRSIRWDDARPERILELKARTGGVKVRILISQPVVERHLVVLGLLLIPVVGAILVLLVFGLLQEWGVATTADEVKRYFKQAGQPTIEPHGTPTAAMGPTHAKIAIVDGVEAVNLGSPFMQSYFGGYGSHPINDPRRGAADATPIHDVSAAVRGPAVADLHEAFRLHWNLVQPDAPIPAIARPGPAVGGDGTATLQVVRTLDGGRFPDPAAGEKGVLEAYLRAIAVAESYIYLENQYFTNDAIANALILALKDPQRAALEVIMLINIGPDVPFYPTWQTALITRMRKSLAPPALQRLGVFTRWTHEPTQAGEPRPRIVPNYVHTKVGIIDDRWATAGSANLDGASLDFFQLLHDAQPEDVRNTEVNLVVLPEPGMLQHPLVDLLRRRLWAEHLGFDNDAGAPDPDALNLAGPAPAGGWLPLWTGRAQAKLDQLKTDPSIEGQGSILPWPTVDKVLDKPRKHLTALLGKAPELGVVKKTRSFDFMNGEWTEDSTTKLDV
ncbi:phospholipase D-like domain-containing protein [Kribbella sp. NBC_01484]|uniref:phospholipase D-like domain-containing protein n=1 Tax=Kribbella sp. NBC_01484 TaxID=2903579 RepID=UPI002E369384|nr:phospholipase D-like domain-containing protein [Kribbella sp. NBC_01484]